MTEPATRRLRMVVAYDGSPYSGFARQRGRRTVQGELEAALAKLAGGPVTVVGAGRTDAGVHARGQVVHADVPARLQPERVRRILNAVLGPVIVTREVAWAPERFDARFSARRRTYVYRVDDSAAPDPLSRGFVLHWPRPLDLERMRAGAAPLVGEHDFAAFCRRRAESTTQRRLRSVGVRRVRGLVEIRLVADAFCWQMVRSIVGHLLAVGDGRRDPASTRAVLASRDRAAAGDLAPPHALVLEAVSYAGGSAPRSPPERSSRRSDDSDHDSDQKLRGAPPPRSPPERSSRRSDVSDQRPLVAKPPAEVDRRRR